MIKSVFQNLQLKYKIMFQIIYSKIYILYSGFIFQNVDSRIQLYTLKYKVSFKSHNSKYKFQKHKIEISNFIWVQREKMEGAECNCPN